MLELPEELLLELSRSREEPLLELSYPPLWLPRLFGSFRLSERPLFWPKSADESLLSFPICDEELRFTSPTEVD
jgi:hypothetical protein